MPSETTMAMLGRGFMGETRCVISNLVFPLMTDARTHHGTLRRVPFGVRVPNAVPYSVI